MRGAVVGLAMVVAACGSTDGGAAEGGPDFAPVTVGSDGRAAEQVDGGAAEDGGNPSGPTNACATNASNDPTDLLVHHDWSRFAGASVMADCSVHMRPIGRLIVQQNGTGGQANPPVAILGPHLDVTRDFEVTWKMGGVDAHGAYFHFYGEVPVIYDEWRQERHSVRFGIVNGQLAVSIWDNTSDSPVLDQKFGSGFAGDVTVGVVHSGKQLVVSVNGNKLATVADHGVFGSGKVWFGADAELGGPGWTLASAKAKASGAGKLTIVDAPSFTEPHADPDALRNLASKLTRPILIGGAIAANPLLSDDPYRALAGAQLSMLTPENDMKPQFVHPQPDVYEFAEADGIVAFAKANGIAVHAHTLVWKEGLAPWMRQVTGAAAVQKMMLDHIDNVAGHFKGQVAEWDVINEPMDDNDDPATKGVFASIWFKAMGEQFIDIALKEAKKIDPQAKLFINEYGCEQDGTRWDNLLALVTRLKARGAPVDGVGFQNHEYAKGDYTPPAQFRAHVQALAKLGIQVRVSEMDVLGSDTLQATEFAGKLKVCREEPNCTSFTTWGLTARYGSTADITNYPPGAGPGVFFDENLQPTSGFTAVQAGLR
jgi:endo-1,4-beta-xylanase